MTGVSVAWWGQIPEFLIGTAEKRIEYDNGDSTYRSPFEFCYKEKSNEAVAEMECEV